MQISQINIFPIKSLKCLELDQAKVESRGLQFDRRWMLTDKNGMFFTQRETPKMSTIAVAVKSGWLEVTSETAGVLKIPFEPDRGEWQNVVVWQSTVAGEVYIGEISEWFSVVLQRKCQLVRMPDASERHINPRFDTGKDIVSFADGYPMMLIGEASLADLNERIAKTAESKDEEPPVALPMERFRPNFVVEGSEPYEEDRWRTIRVGETLFRSTKPCERCVITTVDQSRGEFDGKEPLKTLATYRIAKEMFPDTYESRGVGANAVLFGQNLVPENPGSHVRIGDPIVVLETY